MRYELSGPYDGCIAYCSCSRSWRLSRSYEAADRPALDGALDGYPALAATRADFLRRAGLTPDAAAAYRVAINQANTEAERRYFQRRLTEISEQK